MADQLDSDSTPQRKRIAVACGRCRKRKIRCSGDPGQGQPCSNCKNAGVDQCQFLRVSSREAPLRHDTGDFGYSVGDARVFASRTPVGGGMPYAPDGVPSLGSSDVLGPYRGGSSYAYTPASKAYYPAMHAYGSPYPEEFEFGLGLPSPSVMHPDPVGMLPGSWSSGARAKPPPFSSMYMDSEGYGSYGTASLLHRPSHPVSSESPGFSFAASLPLSSTPGADRLLPNPAGRSSTLPYPTAVKPPTPASTSATSTLADVATAASYAGGFDTPGLSFSSAASSSLSSHPSSSSRSNSDAYSASEGIFTEQERSLQSQGPAFDMNGYTSSPRRDSGAGGAAAGSHVYVPGERAHEAAAVGHHHSYMGDAPPSSPVVHRSHGPSLTSGGGSTSHASHSDDRQVAVASRH
ncbi:hypothetical protein N657DRAFT_657784 [Parathielavia appendiculata]|uniref:Zn(2)-C6 fungal-type domain-containing protein n=1 Tax=Parathielavia appendiculata TaxID=2587402 RepID=A0AAN6TVW3_9PEZI|nr:hypothetical protein N657DRAFT_657784 [Parathielavia appendiculata]